MSDDPYERLKPPAAAKLLALREALERDGSVTFKNGSEVTMAQTEVREFMVDTPKVIPHVEVERPAGGISRHSFDDAGLRRAYVMALFGPAPKAQPSGDPDKYGADDDPPF